MSWPLLKRRCGLLTALFLSERESASRYSRWSSRMPLKTDTTTFAVSAEQLQPFQSYFLVAATGDSFHSKIVWGFTAMLEEVLICEFGDLEGVSQPDYLGRRLQLLDLDEWGM